MCRDTKFDKRRFVENSQGAETAAEQHRMEDLYDITRRLSRKTLSTIEINQGCSRLKDNEARSDIYIVDGQIDLQHQRLLTSIILRPLTLMSTLLNPPLKESNAQLESKRTIELKALTE